MCDQPNYPSEWLALKLVPGLSNRKVYQLYQAKISWPHQWLAQLSLQQRHYLEYLLTPMAKESQLEPLLCWQNKGQNRHLLFPSHPAWPSLFNELIDPPIFLWAEGDLTNLAQISVAIVGSRRPREFAYHWAKQFSYQLAAQGICIISGFAYGIDAQAHCGALAACGRTIAVLGCGLDQNYPRCHQQLRTALLANQGLLITEFAPSILPLAPHFPQRNRLISGLSWGCVVVEAGLTSGSMVTARSAIEQNREVFALPGDINEPGVAGCLQLIQQGAHLVTSYQDVLAQLPEYLRVQLQPQLANKKAEADIDSVDKGLLKYLTQQPQHFDQLVVLSRLTAQQCAIELQKLELIGTVRQTVHGWQLTG